jgi:hypothetical protein
MPSTSPITFAFATAIVVGLILTALNLSRLHDLAGTSHLSMQLDYESRAFEHMLLAETHSSSLRLDYAVRAFERTVPSISRSVEATPPTVIPDVVQLSQGLPAVDRSSNITTALSCKALFGDVDLMRVALWVAYYRLLGFDHIFLFHQDSVTNHTGYDLLQSLPYVTLTPVQGHMVDYKKKSQKSDHNTTTPYWRFVGTDNQKALQTKCLRTYAKDYDWVMFADIDEYLSFSEEMGIKDFIAKYSEDNISLGFGKYMYTLTARVDEVDSGFGLDMYPFTPGVFCKKKLSDSDERFRKECSGFFGSTKVIVRPQHFANGINGVHGPRRPNKNKGFIQINTDVARFFEYPSMHQSVDTSYHNQEKEDFSVSSGFSLRMKYFNEAYAPNENGTWTIRYDDTPHKWYKYVASRGMMDGGSVQVE